MKRHLNICVIYLHTIYRLITEKIPKKLVPMGLFTSTVFFNLHGPLRLITTLCAYQVSVTKLGTREIGQIQLNLCPSSVHGI